MSEPLSELALLTFAGAVYVALGAARYSRPGESGHDRAERREADWHQRPPNPGWLRRRPLRDDSPTVVVPRVE